MDRDESSLQLDELATLARRFADQAMYDEAEALFEMALRHDPKNMGMQLSLAQVRNLQQHTPAGQNRSAHDMLHEHLRRSALDAKHFLGLAKLYSEKGEDDTALEYLKVAESKDLPNPVLHRVRGQILARTGDFQGSADQLARALRYNPFDRATAEALGRAQYECRRFEEALRATVDAFLLLPEEDVEGSRRLKKRIRELKDLLEWSSDQLVVLFHQRQDELHTAFDRLEWHRERYRQEEERGSASALQDKRSPAKGRLALATRIRELDLWSHLNDEQVFTLTRAVKEQFYGRGDVLFEHGSKGADILVVESGEITIRWPTPYGTFPLATLSRSDLVGEISFITRSQRAGDAVASEPSRVLRFDAEALDRIIQESNEIGVQLFWSFWHGLAHKLRTTNEQLRTFFEGERMPESYLELRKKLLADGERAAVEKDTKIRLFQEQGLSGNELVALSTFSRERTFPAGAYIFQEGDQGEEMYVVLEGRVRISKYIPGGGEEALAILNRGDFFGEMSMIDGHARSADARAHDGPVTLIALDQGTIKEVFSMEVRSSLKFLRLLTRLIAKRLREIDEKIVTWRIMAGQHADSL
jgi:CRP-like cAMP-binding protein/Tfp pilus assembly protein PilF